MYCGRQLKPASRSAAPSQGVLGSASVSVSHAVSAQIRDASTLAFLRNRGSRARWVTSVYTGSLILGAAGLLDGYRATSHWRARDAVLPLLGTTPVDEWVVFDRNRAKAARISAGLHFALALTTRLPGEEYVRTAQVVAEYARCAPFDAGGRMEQVLPSPERQWKSSANSLLTPVQRRRLCINTDVWSRTKALRGSRVRAADALIRPRRRGQRQIPTHRFCLNLENFRFPNQRFDPV